MVENPQLSNCSSATSIGDSELSLKRPPPISATNQALNPNSHPSPSTPVRPIINLIPAEEPAFSPKRSRFIDDLETTPTTHKRNNTDSLLPPIPERTSLSFESTNPPSSSLLIPASLPTQQSNFPMGPPSFSQSPNLFSSPNPAPFSTGFNFTSSQNFNTNPLSFNTQPFSSSQIMKFSQKFEQIFSDTKQGPPGYYKSEHEKKVILFGLGRSELTAQRNESLNAAHKDPHGLDWLKDDIKQVSLPRKNSKSIQKSTLQKKVLPEKHPFDLLLPQTTILSRFRSFSRPEPLTPSKEPDEPSYTFDFEPTRKKNPISKEPDEPLFTFLPARLKNPPPTPPKTFSLLLKPGYHTNPTPESLSELPQSSLSSVKPFTLENENGKIVFLNPLNLLSINFSNLSINKGSISVSNPFPNPNENFNTHAKITLFNCHPLKPVPTGDFIDILRSLCSHFHSKFQSWDPETGDWTFTIETFEFFNT